MSPRRHGDAGGSLRVFEQFSWLEVGSVKAASSRPAHQRVTPTVSWLEIGVSQMSGNILMILKVKLTIETDNRATVGVHPEVIFS